MRRGSYTQLDIADKAGVSQSSVCRALRGKIRSTGPVRARLFSYIQQDLEATGHPLAGEIRVLEAFKDIWDGSEEHAAAIAEVITATRGLRPPETKGERK
jgi:transcriptional regulator with XRE-family HTH domain